MCDVLHRKPTHKTCPNFLLSLLLVVVISTLLCGYCVVWHARLLRYVGHTGGRSVPQLEKRFLLPMQRRKLTKQAIVKRQAENKRLLCSALSFFLPLFLLEKSWKSLSDDRQVKTNNREDLRPGRTTYCRYPIDIRIFYTTAR